MNKYRGIVVGLGYFSQYHLEAWSRMDDVEIVAVCDQLPERAASVASEWNVPNSGNDLEVLLSRERPDFVDIITRPDSHLELTRLVAQSGCDIICQKPLTPSYDESQELVQTASSAGVRLMVHENFRFQPWYREMRRLIEDGCIGSRIDTLWQRCRTGDGWQPDAYLARQPYFRDMPRFLIFETGVHFIDTFRYLGGEIEGVYARLRQLNPDIAGEDTATVMFEFANGTVGTWDASRYSAAKNQNPRYTFGEMQVDGEAGTLRLATDGQLTIQRLGEPERLHEYSPSRENFAGDCVYATQRHFIDCLKTGAEFETSGEQYLRTLTVQEAVYQSARDHQFVGGLLRKDESHANR